MTTSRFQPVTGVFNCDTCGRKTRETVSRHLCAQCDEWSMIENSISDGCYSGDAEGRAKAEALILSLKTQALKKGGDSYKLGLTN